MRAEIEVEVGGERHTLALPIAGLEDVSKVNPYLTEVYGSLAMKVWKLDELRAVLRAGLKYGKSSLSADALIESEGLDKSRMIALDLMKAAFRDDSGNSNAAAGKATSA